MAQGPLHGVRIVELGGIGPAPFCAMLLADLGADIIRIERITHSDGGVRMEPRFNVLQRSRRSVRMDLKDPEVASTVLRLVEKADGLIEGFRPGTAERLGLGPDECLKANPKLVYGRMTGWGQDGPLADEPGHDINYIAITGLLHAIGRKGEPPAIPLNIGGDFGGGSLYLALGLVSAILEARQSGMGQVVDAAMIDGAASLITMVYGMHAAGYWADERGSNRLDSGAPWYNVYETLDQKYISIGANEARFFNNAVRLLGIDESYIQKQHDRTAWPEMKRLFAEAFKTRTRNDWAALALGKEVCIAPVLSLSEAPAASQMKARNTFVEVDNVIQPAPAPRFSRTPGAIQCPPNANGTSSSATLSDWGVPSKVIDALRSSGSLL